MGNPTSYYNGNKTYSMVWENGRQANMMFCDGKYKVFKYNADGIRTQKTVSSSYTENYRLDGDRVVELVRTYNSGNVYRLAFTYDESGNPFSVDCYYGADDTTPTTYYYVLNLQGDVIQLRDENDVVAANYTYDAWGKILSISNADNANITLATHISNLNPFKYRGYFYDSETGFYYCNSRYYDPQMRRFINADEYVYTGQGYTSYNMFAYCLNNPVIYVDSDGREPEVAWEWWLTFGAGLSVVDGPLPIGDIVLVGGCLVLGTISLFFPEPEPLEISIDIPNVLFEEENNEGTDETNSDTASPEPALPDIDYPGDDSTTPPGDDYEWKGKPPKGGDKGSWVNKNTGEQLHPDLNHKDPIGPHWDYKDPFGNSWRIFSDKSPVLK